MRATNGASADGSSRETPRDILAQFPQPDISKRLNTQYMRSAERTRNMALEAENPPLANRQNRHFSPNPAQWTPFIMPKSTFWGFDSEYASVRLCPTSARQWAVPKQQLVFTTHRNRIRRAIHAGI